MSRTYAYRVLRSSWGVRVILRAEARTGPPDPAAVPVVDGLFVLDATGGARLSPEQMDMLVRGLALVAAEVPGAPVTVAVQEVEHNELDYQDEGMAAAILGWAVAEFGLAPREIPVHYPGPGGWYVFDFDAVRPTT